MWHSVCSTSLFLQILLASTHSMKTLTNTTFRTIIKELKVLFFSYAHIVTLVYSDRGFPTMCVLLIFCLGLQILCMCLTFPWLCYLFLLCIESTPYCAIFLVCSLHIYILRRCHCLWSMYSACYMCIIHWFWELLFSLYGLCWVTIRCTSFCLVFVLFSH
jgi:hypothetical protein